MKLTQNPFSLYDFLGYFIPGAILIYAFIFMDSGAHFSINCILETIKLENIDNYLPFIIFAYLSGHLISFISSYTVEKYAVWRYGFPSKFLLNVPHDGYFNKSKKIKHITLRVVIALLLIPLSIFDLLFGLIFNFKYWNNRIFDVFSIDMITQNMSHAYSKISKNSKPGAVELKDQDFFTILYHYVLERNKNHSIKIQNYVALFGFLRCITFLFVLIFWYVFYQLIISNTSFLSSLTILSLIAFISYIFFLSFLKFYKRYSMEILMALTTMEH